MIGKMPQQYASGLTRRTFVTGVATGGALLGLGATRSVGASTIDERSPVPVMSGTHFNLDIGYEPVNFTGRKRLATAINGSVPAPTLRWREGDQITLRVRNQLALDSSIHWHGIILPAEMDGVPCPS